MLGKRAARKLIIALFSLAPGGVSFVAINLMQAIHSLHMRGVPQEFAVVYMESGCRFTAYHLNVAGLAPSDLLL